jgi:nucleoside-diphosphate-sugar epimerase
MGDLAQRIWAAVNPKLPFPGFTHLSVPPSDVRFRVGVSEKAKRILDWEPQYTLDDIIVDALGFIRQKLGDLQ